MFDGDTSRWTTLWLCAKSSARMISIAMWNAAGSGTRRPSSLNLRSSAREVEAVDVLHRDEQRLADAAEVEHLDDVRVRQPDRDLGLGDEPRRELGVARELGQDPLDRERLLEAVRAVGLREKHLRHAADRDAVQHVVAFEGFLERFVHVRGRDAPTPAGGPWALPQKVAYSKGMTTGLPARVAICAVLTVQTLPARADGSGSDSAVASRTATKTPNAVRSPSSTSPSRTSVRGLIGDLYNVLNNHVDLKTPNKRGFDTALAGRFADEDQGHIATARNYLASAQNDLEVEADAPTAASQARLGQAELAQVVPTTEVRSLYADLSLVDRARAARRGHSPGGELRVRAGPPDRSGAAARSGALSTGYRSPRSSTRARPSRRRRRSRSRGNGHVWIDFVDRGSAPATFEGIEVGEHCITVVGADRLTKPVLPILPRPSEPPNAPILPRSHLVTVGATINVPDANADDMVQGADACDSRCRAHKPPTTMSRVPVR